MDVPLLGDLVISWNPKTGEVKELYSLFDYLPATGIGAAQNVFPQDCNGTKPMVLDWSHANSISVSDYDGSYIVSARALSTICSFKPLPDLGGVNWCISGENPDVSDFTFESEDDKFSGQHSVYQLGNGNLLMMDNSNARVEIYNTSTTSRGIEYELDWDTMVAKVLWQYPLVYTNHEGRLGPTLSVYYL